MKKYIILTFLGLFFFLSFFFVFATPVKAATSVASCQDIFQFVRNVSKKADAGSITEPLEIFSSIECAAVAIINLLLELGTGVAAFYIMMAGISYMTAAGNAKKQGEALAKINSAVIGFALLLVSLAAYKFILNFIEYNNYIDQFQNVQMQIEVHPPVVAP